MLLHEANQVVAKIQIDLDAEIRKINPKNYDQKYTDTKQKYFKYRKKLEVKRSKKWKNVREKSGSNSKQNASSNAPNVDKDTMLLKVSHKNHNDCCYVRENLKDSPDSFLGTNMVSEANVHNNKIKNENTKIESAIDEMAVVKVNETFITDNCSENMLDLDFLSSQDEDLVNILEELQNRTEVLGDNITEITSSNRLKGHFCSDTVFSLSHRILSDAKIKIRKNLLQILAIYQPLLPNLRGNHLKVILIWKFFKPG